MAKWLVLLIRIHTTLFQAVLGFGRANRQYAKARFESSDKFLEAAPDSMEGRKEFYNLSSHARLIGGETGQYGIHKYL